MGIICLEPNKNYAVRFYYNDCFGNRQRKYRSGFPSEKKAMIWEMQEKEKYENAAPSNNLLMGDYIQRIWLQSRYDAKVSISTLKKYQTYLPTIMDRIGRLELQKVNERHCQAIINEFRHLPPTAHEYKKILNAMFNYAKRRRLIRENPLEFVETPKYQVRKISTYSFAMVSELLRKMKESNSKLYTPCLLAILFSITREEACPLLESDLDESIFSIKVDKALVDGTHNGKRIKETKEQKTENRQREFFANKEIFDEIHWYKNFNKIKSEYVCCNLNGTQMQPNTISSAFPKFIAKHNMPYTTFHGLRHTFSTLCKKAGIDSDTVFRMMGHSRYTTTVEHYNAADPELIKNATQVLFENIKKD